MRLRLWQTRCINRALESYHSGQRHFLSVATPGAGKTVMASALADRLFKAGLIDLVVCLTPSKAVKASFTVDLCAITGLDMSGKLGSKGCVITYQSLRYLPKHFWQLFDSYKIFVIFDEVHHCGASDDRPGNAWGEAICSELDDRARYTLSLSGTPWRSDELPIVFGSYARTTGRLKPDYVYSLQQAIEDGVCRQPQIVVIDNDGIEVTRSPPGTEPYTAAYCGIQQLFSEEDLPYQMLLETKALLSHVLLRAITQLKLAKSTSPTAAGLIVASTINQARVIHAQLSRAYGQSSVLITHETTDAAEQLKKFRSSQDDWIVSVGMVSEGTNIPRLQVCCHLSRIKTELHFRQVLGRILRSTQPNLEKAYMFILADEKLVSFAQRVAKDLPPEATVVNFERYPNPLSLGSESEAGASGVASCSEDTGEKGIGIALSGEAATLDFPPGEPSYRGTRVDAAVVSLFGHFMEELIVLKTAFKAV